MKAIVWTRYGPPEVLEYREVEKPTPKDDEVLIKIFASTVTAGDSEMRNLKFAIYFSLPIRLLIGFTRPRGMTIPGTELSGEIEAVGKDVQLFKVGDQVFGSSGLGFGANAEYKCLPETGSIAVKPLNMTYEEAATVPFGGRDSLHFIRLANLQSGDKILINGAGGSIGTFAVQLAKHFGAEVTAVDRAEKLEMLRSIGADHVVDYKQEGFRQSGETYDVILDVVGTIAFSPSDPSLKQNGTYLSANPGIPQLLGGMWTRMRSNKKVVLQTADPKPEDFAFLRELIEEKQLRTVIDRSYPLEQIVEAHRYVDTGHKKGNVVLTLAHNPNT